MPWEVLDHTADTGVVVTAGDRESLFVEALRALTDCVTRVERVRALERRAVRLAADDAELLLVEWLGEALFHLDTEAFLAGDARVAITDGAGGALALEGEMVGETHDPGRHPHKLEIKAITYHALEVTETAAGWRATVIFDI